MKIINSTTHKEGNKFVITPRRRFWRDKSGNFYPVEFQAMSNNRYNIIIGGDRYTYWFSPRSTNTPFLLIRDIVECGFWGLYIDGLGRTKPALIDNQHILFREIKDGVDIEFVVKNTGVEKRVIFKNRSALADFRFSIVGYPHRPAREKGCFAAGKIAFSGVSAYDSREDVMLSPVLASTIFDGRWLSFSLPEEFLDTAVFPITIDPTITIQPDADEGKDTMIAQEHPSYSYGSFKAMQVKNDSEKMQRALVQFNLSGIPAGANIISATFILYGYPAGSGSGNHELYRLTHSWVEGIFTHDPPVGATWNCYDYPNSWETAGGDYSDLLDTVWVGTHKDAIFDAKVAVQNWVNGTWANYGFIVLKSEIYPSYNAFYSSDHSDTSKHPKLVVEYEERPAIRRHFWMDEFGTLHPIGGY